MPVSNQNFVNIYIEDGLELVSKQNSCFTASSMNNRVCQTWNFHALMLILNDFYQFDINTYHKCTVMCLNIVLVI